MFKKCKTESKKIGDRFIYITRCCTSQIGDGLTSSKTIFVGQEDVGACLKTFGSVNYFQLCLFCYPM